MNDRSIIDLLYRAKESRIDIFLNEGQLQLKLPKEKDYDKNLLEEIKSNKEDILFFLKNNERTGKKNNKINKVDRQSISRIPLSFSQERLWFVDQLEGTVPYHVPFILSLKGKLDKEALNYALKSVVDRHEVLRTVILSDAGTGYQHIRDSEEWQLQIADSSMYLKDSKGLDDEIGRLVKAPFDLSKDYTLRANLLCLGKENYVLVTTMHHIASDGWSTSVFVKELIELYGSFIEGRSSRLETLPIQYADYAVWQRNHLQGNLLENKIAYWKEKLDGVTPIALSTDYARPVVQSTRGAVITFSIEKDLSFQLQALSQQYGATLFMTLLATLKVLLYRYSGQQDICVGIGNAGRQHKELEGLIGFFVNMLALRSEVHGNAPFTEMLQQLKALTLEAYEYQDVPFEKIVNAVVEERDMSRSPLFQVLFEMQNTPGVPALRLGEVELLNQKYEQGISKFDLTFFLKATPSGLQGSIQYCTDLYSKETIVRMLGHYKELLTSIAKSPDQKIGQLQMLALQEEIQLLREFNNTEAIYPKGKSVIALIEDQAANTPNNTAIIFREEKITYLQLNERANQLAHHLKAKGVKAGKLIPVFTERSPEMIIAILGILKAGGTYVPIDTDYPIERINYLLKDIAATILVSISDGTFKLQDVDDLEIVVVDDEESFINLQPKTNLNTPIDSSDLAYVIYTSGSTGQPKGVMIEHGSLLNYLVNNKAKYLTNNEGNSGTFLHLSYTFDASVTGIFMPLMAGKSIVIGSQQSAEVFEDSNLWKYAPYDFIKLTPSHLPLLEPVFEKGSLLTGRLVIGGEALRLSHFSYLVEKGLDIEIVNEYGPTEATVGCSTYRFYTIKDKEKIGKSNSISIGKPMDNVQLYILDNQNDLSPIGVAGEICIGGAGVARGYLNREGLTEEKFINNPFVKEGEKLYKTGDTGKWLADGNIEYIGRKDDQVKIRGYRLEPGEIEDCLLSIEGIRDAKVIVSENEKTHHKLLNAYLQVDKGKLLITESIDFINTTLAYLNMRLPTYMIPANIILLDQFPLTKNGKIDTKALPKSEGSMQIAEEHLTEEAATETEQALIEIWKNLLGLETVGIHDNFFNLGGDSIITIQLVSRARNAGYKLAVPDVFTHQTIARLGKYLEQTAKSSSEVMGEQGLLKGDVGLLPIQQWFFENAPSDNSHFNQSVLLGINKEVTESMLQLAIEQLTAHHDALRFVYQQTGGKWQQEYGLAKGEIFSEDLQFVPEETLGSFITERATYYQRNLIIEKGELMRVVLMKTPQSDVVNRLFIAIHHLAIDGVSWRILLDDLEMLINAFTLESKVDLGNKSISYRQWYNALEKYGESNRLSEQKNFWQQAVASYKALQVDGADDSEIRMKDTCSLVVQLSSEETSRLLHDVPRVFHTEINDILLCAVALTLCEWNNTDKIVIGLEGHGREHLAEGLDTSRTVGWFTTIFPVLLSGDKDKKAGDLIKTVKEQLRQVPDKGLGYGVLRYLNKEETLQGKQPWDVIFNYMGQIGNAVKENKWLSIASESTGLGISEEQVVKEKLSINSSIRSGALVLNWVYSNKNFEEETIRKITNSYITNLQWLISEAIEQGKTNQVFTPSDYGLGAEIGYAELDAFLEEDNIDNIMSF